MNENEELLSAGVLSYFEPESVCGEDSRYQVWQTNTVPYYYACHLRITFQEGVFVGSAFPVIKNDKHLVFATSGHCVFAAGRFAQKIEISPARNVNDFPYGMITVQGADLRASAQWQAQGANRKQFDYGAILAPADTPVGTIGIANLSDAELKNRVVSNCGYPADKPFGTMWWCGGPITEVEDRLISYMADTFGGQSGSQIYTWCDDNIFRAIGIHGYGGCPNSAVRFTDDVINDFNTWANS